MMSAMPRSCFRHRPDPGCRHRNRLSNRRRSGLGLVEIIVAVVVIAVGLIPLMWLTTATRTDTSKAINYLRALELANEGIEWAQAVPFDRLGELPRGPNFGSLYQGVIQVSPQSKFQGTLANSIPYPGQYDAGFFFRSLEVRDVDQESRGFLKRVTVTVGWNEAKAPEFHHDPERMRAVELSCLLFDDDNPEY